METHAVPASLTRTQVFPNLGKKSVQGSESFWGPQTDIWTPASELDRRDLHLVDWDNSGVCDIVWVDPSSGNVRVWANEYPTTKSWDTAFHEVAAPELACAEKPGTGIHDCEFTAHYPRPSNRLFDTNIVVFNN